MMPQEVGDGVVNFEGPRVAPVDEFYRPPAYHYAGNRDNSRYNQVPAELNDPA